MSFGNVTMSESQEAMEAQILWWSFDSDAAEARNLPPQTQDGKCAGRHGRFLGFALRLRCRLV
jgi:hypothetical protein